MEFEIFQRLGLALAIGALVGAERHWREREDPDAQRPAGLRTFTLVGLVGGGAGLIERGLASAGSRGATGFALAGLALGVVYALTAFMLRQAEADRNFSATSVIAALATFVLGAIATLGDMRVAAAGGVALTAILASREALHSFMRTLIWAELRSAIVLAAMTLVVLPLLPTAPIGPFGGVSPARVWVLAILLAAISFIGYVAVRWLGGARGELIGGAIGGLLSSTGATVALARRSLEAGEAKTLAAGALAAGSVSLGRTLVLAAGLAPALAGSTAPSLAAAALAMAAFAAALAWRDGEAHAEPPSRNPFSLFAVLKMALLLAAIGFLAQAATAKFGPSGAMWVAGLSGLADVDAATATVAGMAGAELALATASLAILLAAVSNTIAKAVYAVALGSRAFGLWVVAGSGVALATGAAAGFVVASF